MSLKSCSYFFIAFSFLAAGCSSSAIKQRKELRDRAVLSTKMYCEFVNGDVFPNDIDVALNITVAKHCEAGTPVSMTQYKTPSESNGIMFCCPVNSNTVNQLVREGKPAAPAKTENKSDVKEKDSKEPKEAKPAPPSMNSKDELDE